MHQHALQPSSNPKACHTDAGTHDLISLIVQLLTSHLYQQPGTIIYIYSIIIHILDNAILEGEYQASTTVGRNFA